MTTFSIAPINPIRFIDSNSSDAWPEIYHSKPFDLETYKESIFDFQTNRCFFQKFQTNDITRIQFLSDFIPVIRIFNTTTGTQSGVPFFNMGISFPDFTFKVYEADIDFSLYGEGIIYLTIQYIDVTLKTWISEPIDVQEKWENTVLFEVRNDENAFSFVFDTGIVIKSRVEAIIDNFIPKADRIVYNDQTRNATLLSGIPFREFRLNIGGRAGISDWLIDKINRMFACNQVKIDGEYYTASEGAEWEPNRDEEYPLAGWRIPIIPVDNKFNQRLKPTFGDEGLELQMILHANNRTGLSADQSYLGIFERFSVLHGFGIIKASIANPVIFVGTTLGGNEISGPDGYQLTEANQFILINWVFDINTDVYVSGLNGSLVDINMYYYLPFDITPAGGGGPTPPSGSFVKGTVYMYEEVLPGDFSTDWDEVTGLGKINTPYEGCALMDGRNGCGNMIGRVPLMPSITGRPDYSDPSGTYPYTKGQTLGEAKHLLTIPEMPAHSHVLAFDGNISDLDGTGSQQGWEDDGPTNMNTNPTGGSLYHENRQPSYGIIFFKRIID